MAGFQVALSDNEQRVVNAERDTHPDAHVRRKMLALWLIHHGDTRERAAEVVGLGRATVRRYVAAYRDGGLAGLRRWGVTDPVSGLAAHTDVIRDSLTASPARTPAETADRIRARTGFRRGPTQTRVFLAALGFTYQRVRAIPVPPEKTLAEHVATQRAFLDTALKPRLGAVAAGRGPVWFVDAAHCVYGTYRYGKYHPTFAAFKAVIEDTLGQLGTTHAESLASLVTLRFQELEDVSLGPLFISPVFLRWEDRRNAMITYARLAENPTAFLPLTGLTAGEFDRLFDAFTTAADAHRAARTRTKRGDRPLQRAAGAGHPHALDPRTRLAVALVWLRVYPTYAVLGLLFSTDKPSAWHTVQDVLEVLATLADFPFDRPGKDRTSLRTTDAVMAEFPSVRVIVDAKEQGFRRPTGWDDQKVFYSGKKKRHTVKNQVVCTPTGRVGSVSSTAPGRTHDLTLLRHDGVLDRLPDDAGVMTDKGYIGVAGDAGGRSVVAPAKGSKNHPLTDDQKAENRVISGCRVVVEHVMAQLSRFGVLGQVFRGVLGRHSRAFRVVALLVDRRAAVTPLKTYPAAA